MRYRLIIGLAFLGFQGFTQTSTSFDVPYIQLTMGKKVAITIDDVPNTRIFDLDEKSILLNTLDSLHIPTTIFINESKVFRGDTLAHKQLLKSWIEKDIVTCGNHTYSHGRYSTSDYDAYITDIEKGRVLTDKYAKEANKSVAHFRFPFNDLGKDSIQQLKIKDYLESTGCEITPFTIESSDYMFNYAYKYYLELDDTVSAKAIGELYVSETLRLFEYYDSLTIALNGRETDHIYLCHDNRLNTDYLALLIKELKLRDYSFISLDEALADPIYDQENYYYKKWGVSWFYRWMQDPKERRAAMMSEPSLDTINKLYDDLRAKKN